MNENNIKSVKENPLINILEGCVIASIKCMACHYEAGI